MAEKEEAAGEPAPEEVPEASFPASQEVGAADEDDPKPDFGRPGPPISRNNPIYIGFFGALGALGAFYLLQVLGNMSSVLTLLAVSLFLAMGLDPLVKGLERRGLGRGTSIGIVFLGVILVFVGFLAAVVPTVISEGTQLAQDLPDFVQNLQNSSALRKLDADYGVIDKASAELQKRLSSGATFTTLFGGVFGAGRAVVSGVFSTFTVLVLTLYFLASLRNISESFYRLAPASRRERVRLLGNEIQRRIGGYVAGQVGIATINALLTYLLLRILDVPFSLVLAITVGLFGLIPLVGATIGAIVVGLVAFFQSWQTGVIVIGYYALYQQLENYVIAPRIMSRTVAVPGSVAVVAALAGGSLLGILGALVAIPVAAAILLIIDEVVVPHQQRS